ncbi:MAG: peptidylprolyl isomerase [Ruminococcus sp.]|nr:peptidylprolyl isomerase [Ruminococcus sp.]MBQ3947083.1 peptidylprolyl isomerase [Ruminococcus sp.]
MKDARRLIRIILILTIFMGALSLGLMILSDQREKNNKSIVIDVDTMKLVQLEAPKEGDQIAIVDTTLGEIRFVLYPEYSPKAVENFVKLAESGYYDNTYVFDAQDGAYAGYGAKEKNGSAGDDTDERIPRELHQDLWPFRGAVCMVNTEYSRTFKQKILGGGTYYCGSRFDILNSIAFTEEISDELRDNSVSTELAEAFITKGGIPNFSQQLTIIGQTYEGFDVVDTIASLEYEEGGKYNTPKDDVMIRSIKIDKYSSDKENKNKK